MEKKKLVEKNKNVLLTADGNLLPVAQKIVLAIVSRVNKNDKDGHNYRFYISDFFGSNSAENKANMEKAMTSLLENPLEFETEDEWFICNWISSAEFYDNENYVDVSYNPDLKPYLIWFQQCFTIFRLKDILKTNIEINIPLKMLE